jgi:lysophospholipase L1-like esterase
MSPTPPVTTTTPTRTPTPADPLRVSVLGDSTVLPIGNGLVAATRTGNVRATLVFRYSSGLTRPDYYDWPAEAAELLAGARPPEVAVVMLGANDAQPMTTPAGPQRFGTAAWRAEYARRVDAFMSLLVAHRVAVYWVGQPTMGPAAYSARMAVLDGIYAAAARRHSGVRFVDTRPIVTMRDHTPDGIHLTVAAGRRLAGMLLTRIRTDQHLARTTQSSALPRVVNHFVYVLCDSVLLGAKATLPAALPGWRVTMNCLGSRRLVQGLAVLRARTWRAGDTVVIHLGNNYIPGEGGTFASQIDRAMRILRVVRRVVWVTVAEKWRSRVTINRAIRAAARRYPRIRVADWAPVIAAHPSYAYDRLHLSPSGRLAISRLIARRVTGP